MIQDLHSHTYYSFCGKDNPESIINAAIDGGIELFGISDHNYGIGYGRADFFKPEYSVLNDNYGRNLTKYFDHIKLLKEKYSEKIKILSGIEVCTWSKQNLYNLPENQDISFFDYCLVESLSMPKDETVTKGDIFSYADRCGCPAVGIAHTDMFSFIKSIGEDPYKYFKKMAEQNIFWEMNVSFDSIHNYREHQFMLEFFKSEEQQEIIKKSGVRLSVGFDGHRVEDYLPERIKEYCEKIKSLGIKLAFEE